MKLGSLFAGIGGFDLAFQQSGITPSWAAEIDPKCNSVRRKHFPHEHTITDVRLVRQLSADIITAGWPCQGNSVAGKRLGLADDRSSLWWEVARILEEQRPAWFLGENVPGILSVNHGRDWLAVLRKMEELGYGFAYRILDAQWFGVPQRRRRVFLVGCLGNWRRAAQVLFEPESLPWNSPPSRETRQTTAHDTAPCIGASGRGFSRTGESRGQDPVVAMTLNAKGGVSTTTSTSFTLAADETPHAINAATVRRLTPIECERLQGFPDNYTAYGAQGEQIADGPRYRMLGNAVAVPVVHFLAKRILTLCQEAK